MRSAYPAAAPRAAVLSSHISPQRAAAERAAAVVQPNVGHGFISDFVHRLLMEYDAWERLIDDLPALNRSGRITAGSRPSGGPVHSFLHKARLHQ